jgi:hypothetical protein
MADDLSNYKHFKARCVFWERRSLQLRFDVSSPFADWIIFSRVIIENFDKTKLYVQMIFFDHIVNQLMPTRGCPKRRTAGFEGGRGPSVKTDDFDHASSVYAPDATFGTNSEEYRIYAQAHYLFAHPLSTGRLIASLGIQRGASISSSAYRLQFSQPKFSNPRRG